jgi:hypothetical protein
MPGVAIGPQHGSKVLAIPLCRRRKAAPKRRRVKAGLTPARQSIASEHDVVSSNRHHAPRSCSTLLFEQLFEHRFCQNRFPLFGAML